MIISPHLHSCLGNMHKSSNEPNRSQTSTAGESFGVSREKHLIELFTNCSNSEQDRIHAASELAHVLAQSGSAEVEMEMIVSAAIENMSDPSVAIRGMAGWLLAHCDYEMLALETKKLLVT